jgi:alkanesulfonate monooxygenase SsuD/methylene tetrahydromethanopterin reductase-like flavin-dependent oxidoreductase (luciferase family)
MCQVAGEIADGVRPHPICSAEYIADVMIPEVRKGAKKAGRSLANFRICHKPLVATAANAAELATRVRDVRARLAFYVSTPAYRPAVEHHGLGDLARQLSRLARAQDWERMPGYISDEILNRYAVIGTHDEIAERLCQRFGGILTNCEFSIAVKNDGDKEQLRQIVKHVHAHPLDAVRRRLNAAVGA